MPAGLEVGDGHVEVRRNRDGALVRVRLERLLCPSEDDGPALWTFHHARPTA